MSLSVAALFRSDNANITIHPIKLATAPQPGDVVLLCIGNGSGTDARVKTVTGLGATWTELAYLPGTGTNSLHINTSVWVGRGATMAGDITLAGSVTAAVAHGLLLRGANGTIAVEGTVYGSSTTQAGPLLDAGPGQIAIDFVYSVDGNRTGVTHLPADGWVESGTLWGASLTGFGRTSHRLPGVEEPHRTSISGGTNGYNSRITRITAKSGQTPEPPALRGAKVHNGTAWVERPAKAGPGWPQHPVRTHDGTAWR